MILDLTSFGLTEVILSLKATNLANFFAMLIGFSSIIVLFLTKNYKLSKSFYALFYCLPQHSF